MGVTVDFFALPAELRLHVAEHVFEQPRDASSEVVIVQHQRQVQSAQHLRPLLVCRQFYKEFRIIAYNKTPFSIQGGSPYESIANLPEERLQHVRKLELTYSNDNVAKWDVFPFNKGCLRLDELSFVMFAGQFRELPSLLRRLQHVDTCTFIAPFRETRARFHTLYHQIVGLILKEDHFQRYDAPGAPNIEKTWWEWSFHETQISFTLRALPPKPAMAEEEYMRFVKPHVDALMQDVYGGYE